MAPRDENGPIGKQAWLIAGGFIPLASHGPEPELTGHEKLAILNLADAPAKVTMTLFFEDHAPAAGYELTVPARRVSKVRFNDLIDPRPLPLERRYACLVRSSVPVVVQLSGLDSSHRRAARLCTIAFPVE
jgi:hypothetical protein